ncbi:DUF5403 family protein [Streptomyces morookaense]|uniref:DUF5403 family protein n=1 Tax=Streptomyces morookaense TaxID=1970 RepID=UPI003405922A
MKPTIHKTVAGLPGVMQNLKGHATVMAGEIKAVAAPHRKTGAFEHGIKVRRLRKGYAVNLEDRNSASINYGHFTEAGVWVDGIHAVEHVVGAGRGSRSRR